MKKLHDFLKNSLHSSFSTHLITFSKKILRMLTLQSFMHPTTACDLLAPGQYYNAYYSRQKENIWIVFDRTLNVLNALTNSHCGLQPDAKNENNYLLEDCACPVMLPDGPNKAYYSSVYIYALNATTDLIECVKETIEGVCPQSDDDYLPYIIIFAASVGLIIAGTGMYACYKKMTHAPADSSLPFSNSREILFSNTSGNYQYIENELPYQSSSISPSLN